MAEDCNDCAERNPVIPTYSKAKPIANANCGDCDEVTPIFTPPSGGSGGGGLPVTVTGITPIAVDDQSNSAEYRFVTRYDPVIALAVTLTLKDGANSSFPSISLFGVVYTDVKTSWVYNRPADISSQALSNNGGINPPTLAPSDTSYDFTNQTISDTVKFTITGDDGDGLSTSIATNSKSIVFGNYFVYGKGIRMNVGGKTATELKSLIDALVAGQGTAQLDTNRTRASLIAEGVKNEHFYVAIPKKWGYASFWQFGSEGGMLRLADVGGNIVIASKNSQEAGENDILISNGIAEEAYYIYQSQFDNINGVDFEVK